MDFWSVYFMIRHSVSPWQWDLELLAMDQQRDGWSLAASQRASRYEATKYLLL